MEEQKVSVVMSCYNAEKTLERAMTSVLSNTYRNIELLVIEDCSTDNSLHIASKIADKDNRVKIIQHKDNQGAGVSRKDGIEKAEGEYICFCDSDDELKENHIKNLVEASIKYDADLVTTGFCCMDGETGELLEDRKVDKVEVLEEARKYAVLKADVLRFLNPSLVRKHLWNKVPYSTRRFIEDSPTLIKLLWYANKRVVLPESTYLYYQNKGSLTHIEDTFREILYQTLCVIDSYKFFTEEVNNPAMSPAIGVMTKVAQYLASNPTERNKKEFIKEIQEVKQFITKYYEEKFE